MIYLCIPAHNEEQTVGVVLWKLRQVMAELGRDYQLLVADDASTDETPDVLEPYTRVLPLTVFRHDERRGYAASLEMLLREAVRRSEYPRRDVVIVLQADFTEEPDHVDALIRRIESGADIVVSNPAGHGDPSFARRSARAIARLLLRRFSWPDDVADPLIGLNAYRVSTIRRALEERPDRRLLCWEGWAANAALLHAAMPHARRTETVECNVHRERLQRPSRFLFQPMIREVLAFVRGRERAGLALPDALAPASVRTARSHDRVLSVETLREAGVVAAREERTRRNRPARTGRSRNGGDRKGVKEKAPQRAREDEQPGRGSKRGRKKPEPSTAADAAQASAEDVAPAEGTPERPRRKRRSRRRRPGSESATSAATGTQEPDDQEAETPGEVPEGDTADASARPRRRRGRRGGKRRRRPASAEGSGPADSTDGAEDAPDTPQE